MQTSPPATSSVRMPSVALMAYLGMTFLITWGVIGFYLVLPEVATASFGELTGAHPFYFLATWLPAIAAFVVVFDYSGRRGGRAFLSRLLLWRCSVGWAVFILLLLPLVFIAGSVIKGGPVLSALPDEGAGKVVMSLFMMLLLGPIEEFGWRGVMQPLLQRHLAPIWAGLVIGATWGIWHLPAFYLSGTVYADWHFLPFLSAMSPWQC